MSHLQLFRKRLIPDECISLKNDVILEHSDEYIITTWTTLNPKISFHHGCSCYFLKEGFKLSKFYRHDDSLLYWYCDIVEYKWNEDNTALTSVDLLADVIIYPDSRTKVMDLDELADACERGIISHAQLQNCLRQLNKFLTYIYKDKFDHLQAVLDGRGL